MDDHPNCIRSCIPSSTMCVRYLLRSMLHGSLEFQSTFLSVLMKFGTLGSRRRDYSCMLTSIYRIYPLS
jgi:hypothetical protein